MIIRNDRQFTEFREEVVLKESEAGFFTMEFVSGFRKMIVQAVTEAVRIECPGTDIQQLPVANSEQFHFSFSIYKLVDGRFNITIGF